MTIAANGGVRLADADKKRLKTTVLELRRLLEGDLARELKRLGIDPARDAALPVEKLSYLTEAERAARLGLDAALLRERAAGGSFAAAVEAVRREAAYTHLNRLIGLKCLELRGHLRIEGELTETVTCRPEYGGRPKRLWTLREREGRYRYGEDAEELLWREGLAQACAAVTEEIRVLFDPADPYAQVWPSHKALAEAVDKLNSLPEDAFRADELLGWVYQYFQSEEKDQVFEAARTQKKKISGPDIIPVTQLYTEHYMVDFLLQNSLGALWMEMYPDSALNAEWPYYVTPATPHTRPRKPVREWTLLDPCVGSGHFLVVAFDLLLRLYAEERRLAAAGIIPADWAVPDGEVAVTILERNLHGIDIDPRAVQLATLALYLKAKEARLARSPRINIVAADASFLRGEAWTRFLESLKDEPGLQKILAQMAESLADIREIGSLLRPEVELQRIVREVHGEWETKGRRKAEQALLFPELVAGMQLELPLEEQTDEQFWDSMTHRAEQEIHAYVDAARDRGEMVDQVVAGEAERGFTFLALCRRRYDIVCTNPPYMGSANAGPSLRDFLTHAYRSTRRDLYASFMSRCGELACEEGHVAIVTLHTWMFAPSYIEFREHLFKGSTLSTLAHLGRYAFSEADPPGLPVLTVWLTTQPAPHHKLTALRIAEPVASEDQAKLLVQIIADANSPRRYTREQLTFLNLPERPLSYWMADSVLAAYKSQRTVGSISSPRQGLKTADQARFLRLIHEVPKPSSRWVPLVKAGGYQKWCGLEHYMVDWHNDAEALRTNPQARFQSSAFYFKAGVTYSAACRGKVGGRLLGPGFVFDSASPFIQAVESEQSEVCAALNTRLSSYLSRVLGTTIVLSEGVAAKLLVPSTNLTEIVTFVVSLKRCTVEANPLELSFRDVLHPVKTSASPLTPILLSAEAHIENQVFQAVGIVAHDVDLILAETGIPSGWYPLLKGYDETAALLHTISDSRLPPPPDELLISLEAHSRIDLTSEQLTRIRARLRALLIAQPDLIQESSEETNEELLGDDSEAIAPAVGAYIPIPAETLLEELSQKLEIHPISIYWLLEELRHEEGLVSPPDLKRQIEDYFSVKLLRMLGHRWHMQDQYEQEQGHPFLDPRWLDDDGIIPLTPGTGEVLLVDRFARFLDAEFGETRGHAVEVEAGQILGWKPGDEWGKQKPTTVARWFEREFFRRHVSQFKRRPIAWHLSSPRGAFQAIVYYHKFDKNRIALLRARYVRNAIESLRHELARAADAGQDRATLNRIAALEAQLTDVQEFDARLQRLQEGRDREARIWCPWKASAEQPVGWDPDINDGVRVNIAPVQRLGLLAADVLAAKDVKSLLAPEGRG